LATIPAFGIIWLFWYLDKHEREVWWQMVVMAILGCLGAIPALFFEKWAILRGAEDGLHFGKILLTAFVVVALSEELIKFLMLNTYPRWQKLFHSRMDAIVYAVCVSMGFAAFESAMYAWLYGLPTTLIRIFTALPVHLISAILMGYYLGKGEFILRKRWQLMLAGLFAAVFFHGLYDVFIIQEFNDMLRGVSIVILIIGAAIAYILVRDALATEKILHAETIQHNSDDNSDEEE